MLVCQERTCVLSNNKHTDLGVRLFLLWGGLEDCSFKVILGGVALCCLINCLSIWALF